MCGLAPFQDEMVFMYQIFLVALEKWRGFVWFLFLPKFLSEKNDQDVQ